MRTIFRIIGYFLICLCGLNAEVIKLPEIQNPHLILADDSQFYIVENNSISIYSMTGMKKIRKFGHMGEGPGELKQYISGIDIQTGHILINSIGRISWFTKSGDFIRQTNDTTLGHNYKTFGSRFSGMRMVREKNGIFFTINIFNKDLKEPTEVYRYRHPFFNRDRKIDPMNVRGASYFVFNDLLYVDTDGGIIRVFDETGKERKAIDPGIKREKITPVKKKRIIEFWKSDMKEEYKVFKERLEFPEYFPRIRDFQVADHRIYIITNTESGDNVELIILNLEGKNLGKRMVPLSDVNMLLPHLFTFHTIQNNHIYILTDNIESETWELRIIGPLL